jgi:hypothetical protein
VEQGRLVVTGECAKKVKIEAAPGNGGKSEHVTSWATEGLESLLDGIVDTARDAWTTQIFTRPPTIARDNSLLRAKDRQYLLNEKRVALRP